MMSPHHDTRSQEAPSCMMKWCCMGVTGDQKPMSQHTQPPRHSSSRQHEELDIVEDPTDVV